MRCRLTAQVDLDVFYEADSARYGAAVLATVTREAFRRFYADCPSVGFECDGRVVGGVIFDGHAPHIAVLPAWQGHWGTLLRPMLRWLYQLKPDMVVPVDDDNPQIRAFVEKCGWPRIGRTADGTLHRMSATGSRRVAHVQPAPASPSVPDQAAS